jgi:hypothetical protein
MDITGVIAGNAQPLGVIIALSLGSGLWALGCGRTSVWVIKFFDYWAFEMHQGYLPEGTR